VNVVVVGGDQILMPSIPYQESILHDAYKGTDRDPLGMLQCHGDLVVEILGVESVVVAPISCHRLGKSPGEEEDGDEVGIYVAVEVEECDDVLDEGCDDGGYGAAEGAAVQTDTSAGPWSCRSLVQSADEQEDRPGHDDVQAGEDAVDVGVGYEVDGANMSRVKGGYIGPGLDVNMTPWSSPGELEVVVVAG